MNINDLKKQAQQMQENLEKQNLELEKTKFETSVGGGSVKVCINGQYEVESVEINEDLLEKENKEMLQDLIQVAFNEVLSKANQAKDESMASLANGIDLSNLF